MLVDLHEALSAREQWVNAYLEQPRFLDWFRPSDLRDAVFAYIRRPGKRLRPAVLLWSCGAVGGNEQAALPAAAGIELFHTWTLVHDDLIDNDDLRRGGPTVHKLGESHAAEKLGYGPERSAEYGRDLAVLTGDSQHAWTIGLFCECASRPDVDPRVVLDIIYTLESRVVNTLIEGEMLDVQYAAAPVDGLTQDDVMRMLWMKTGVLYEFAAEAGAMLGLNTCDHRHQWVRALARFASRCGAAFQLQDDILGLVGDAEQLGKPVGSDIREGKKTTIVYFALNSASEPEREFLLSVLGNRDASGEDTAKAADLMVSLGAVERTRQLAMEHIESALPELESLPSSSYTDLLAAWARRMVDRRF